MDLPPQSAPAPPPETKVRPPSARGPKLGIAAILVLVGIVLLVPSPTPKQTLAWLSAPEFLRISHGGPLTALKNRLLRLAAPLLAPFQRNRPQITIQSRFLSLPPDLVPRLGLGPPTATNADGERAWIVSATNWEALRDRLKDLPQECSMIGPRVTTLNGGQAQIFAGANSTAGQVIPEGITINMTPTLYNGSVQLLVSLLAIEALPPTRSNSVVMRTNLDAACRAFVPDGGGLLIGPAAPMDTNGRRYFGLLSPTAVDAKGNPIKR